MTVGDGGVPAGTEGAAGAHDADRGGQARVGPHAGRLHRAPGGRAPRAKIARAEHDDLDPALHLLVDHGAHDDVGVAAKLLGDGIHDFVDERQREIGAADEVDQAGGRPCG